MNVDKLLVEAGAYFGGDGVNYDRFEPRKFAALVLATTPPQRTEQEPWCMKMNGCKTKCEDCPDEPPQTEQEPVAWRTFDGEGGYDYRSYEDNESYADDWNKRNPNHSGWVDKLYTHSQRTKATQRTFVGLTDEEIEYVWRRVETSDFHDCVILFAKELEAKLKEKNFV